MIVGGGPGGYAAAFSALSRGHEVSLFEKRELNTRTQSFYMPLDLINKYFSLTELLTHKNFYPQNFFKENYVFDFNEAMKNLIKNEDAVMKTNNHELIFDYEFFKNLYLNFGVLELRAFQDYQIKKAQYMLEKNCCHAYDLNSFYVNSDLSSSQFMIDKNRFQEYRGSEVIGINLEEKKVQYKTQNSEIYDERFDFLIIADGASRKSLDLLQHPSKPNILNNGNQTRHPYWATATIKVKNLQTYAHQIISKLGNREFERPYKIPTTIKLDEIHIKKGMSPQVPKVEYFDSQRVTHTLFMQDLDYLTSKYPAWNTLASYAPEQNEPRRISTPYTPIFYLKIDFAKSEFFWIGEVPYDIEKAQVLDWIKDLLWLRYRQYNITREAIFNDLSSEVSDVSVFNIRHQHLERNYIKLENGSMVIFIGDSAVNPDPNFGDGVDNAIKNGLLLKEVFDRRDSSISENAQSLLQDYHAKRIEQISEYQKHYNEIEYKPLDTLYQEYLLYSKIRQQVLGDDDNL